MAKVIDLSRRKQDTPLMGYKHHNSFYASPKWRSLRAYKLDANPFCEQCGKEGELVIATEVDHIIPIVEKPNLALEFNNLQSLCGRHHKEKTARDNANKKGTILNKKFKV